MTNQWYYATNGQRHGPITEEQTHSLAKSGELQPTDLVWSKGMTEWVPAQTIKGLRFAALEPPPWPTSPPPKESSGLASRASHISSHSPRTLSSYWSVALGKDKPIRSLVLGVVAVVVVVMQIGRIVARLSETNSSVSGTSVQTNQNGVKTGDKSGDTGAVAASANDAEKNLRGDPSVDFGKLDYSNIDYSKGPQGQQIERRESVDGAATIAGSAYLATDGNYYRHGESEVRSTALGGLVVQENYAYGRKHGRSVTTSVNGSIRVEENYYAGGLHGTVTISGPGSKTVHEYRHGKRHGTSYIYVDGNKTVENKYVDGIVKTHRSFYLKEMNSMEGYVENHDDGGRLVGHYKNGQKDGTWTLYDRNDHVVSQEEYRNGSRVK